MRDILPITCQLEARTDDEDDDEEEEGYEEEEGGEEEEEEEEGEGEEDVDESRRLRKSFCQTVEFRQPTLKIICSITNPTIFLFIVRSCEISLDTHKTNL